MQHIELSVLHIIIIQQFIDMLFRGASDSKNQIQVSHKSHTHTSSRPNDYDDDE